jgi:hypothetical protein
MFSRHATNGVLLIVGIAVVLAATQAVRPLSATGRQSPAAGIPIVASHMVDRALKGDRLMVATPQPPEPATTPAPRPEVRGFGIKIGCERPFSALASVKSDVAGRCIARRPDWHSSPA